MSRNLARAVFAFTCVFFLAFFIWPIGITVSGAFLTPGGNFTAAYFIEVFRNPIYLEGIVNAFTLAVWSTALTALIAIPLAFVSNRFDFFGKPLLCGLILLPMILPPFVGAIGLKQILGQEGALNALLIQWGLLQELHPIDWLGRSRFWGIVVLNALHLYPILYLNVVAALGNIDPALDEAAENLGCVGLGRFFRVTLPLIAPGVFAGGTLVFIWAFTELGVPLMFDYTRVTSVQIFNGIRDIGGSPFPFALVVVLLIFTVVFYGLGKVLFGDFDHAMVAKATVGSTSRRLGLPASILCAGAFAGVIFVSILPHLGVILVAFSNDWYASVLPTGWTLDHFRVALGHDLTLPSIRNSLRYASLATVVDIVLGIAIAYVVVRSRIRGREILDAMSMLPLAVPGLVLAFGYLAMTRPGQPFAALDPLKDPLIILVIAYSVRRLPYVVRSVAAGLQQTSVTLEEAAQNLGSTPLRALIRITLPLIMANILAGALLAFSFAMLEVSDSLVLAQRQQDFPITKAIYELSQLLGEGRFVASALGVWAMAFLAVTLLGASVLLGKKLGALFRT